MSQNYCDVLRASNCVLHTRTRTSIPTAFLSPCPHNIQGKVHQTIEQAVHESILVVFFESLPAQTGTNALSPSMHAQIRFAHGASFSCCHLSPMLMPRTSRPPISSCSRGKPAKLPAVDSFLDHMAPIELIRSRISPL